MAAATQDAVRSSQNDPALQASDFPSVGSCGQSSSAVEAAYDAYLKLVESDQQMDPDEFCRRHPGIAKPLKQLIIVHFALEKHCALDSLHQDRTGKLLPGRVFAGFRLIKELGRGKWSRVFRAEVPTLGDRPVVVKISAWSGMEAEIQGPLEHPHVVPANWVENEPSTGLKAIMMPYLGRGTLDSVRRRVAAAGEGNAPRQNAVPRPALTAALIREAIADPEISSSEPLPLLLERGTYFDAVCQLAEHVARALAYLHSRGIQHRDLKPSNVLVTPAGRALVMDFNLALGTDGGGFMVGGTPRYMSPEQLRAFCAAPNEQPALDPQTDLYSLGVIVHELLTGRHPCEPIDLHLGPDELARELLQRQEQAIRPLRLACPRDDRRVLNLFDHCLAYHPSDRPGSAAEVADALSEYLKSREAALQGQAARGRRRLLLGVAATSLVALVVAAFSFFSLTHQEPIPEDPFANGVAAYAQQDYKSAVKWFTQALESNPNDLRALFARGRAYQQWGEDTQLYFTNALADYGDLRAILTGKSKAVVTACLAYCFHRTKLQADSIIPLYGEVRGSGFASPEVLNNYGYLCTITHRAADGWHSLNEAAVLAGDGNPSICTIRHNRILAVLKLSNSGSPEERQARLLGGVKDVRFVVERGAHSMELFSLADQLAELTKSSGASDLNPTCLQMQQAIAQTKASGIGVASQARHLLDPYRGGAQFPDF